MGGIITDLLAKGYEAGPLKSIISDDTALGFTKAGSWLRDTLENRFEPLYKKMWSASEKDITDSFSKVHPSLHSNLHDVVTAGARPATPEVATAARTLGRVQVNPNFNFAKKNLQNEWVRAAGSTAKKNARAAIFGNKDEVLTAVIRGVARERGIAGADSVADIISMYFHDEEHSSEAFRKSVRYGKKSLGIPGIGIRETIPYSSPGDFERKLRKGMSYSFLGRIAVPHLGQVMNPILDVGIRNVAKAAADIVRDKPSAMAFARQAGVFADELLYETERINASGGMLNKIGANLNRPGFNLVRRQELLLSAVAGKHAALEAASQGLRGNVKDAALMLKWFGLDDRAIMSRGWRLTQDEVETAAYRTAERNIFIKNELNTPNFWHRNFFFRIATAYKDFLYQQGGLMKDVIGRDVKRAIEGNPTQLLKTVATLGVAFPIVGELIWSAENLITGHDVEDRGGTEGIERWGEAIAHVGALGIFYSMMRSAARRSLAEWGVGPVFGTLSDMVQDSFSGYRTGNFDPLARDITTKIPVAGPAISQYLFPKSGRGNQ